MEANELQSFLADLVEVVNELSTKVESLNAARHVDSRAAREMEDWDRKERIRTGSPRPPKLLSISEKVASLRERVKHLR